MNGNMRRLRRCDSAKRSHAASFHGIAGASYVHMVPSALKGGYETFVDVAIQFSAFFCCANSSKHRGKACPPHYVLKDANLLHSVDTSPKLVVSCKVLAL